MHGPPVSPRSVLVVLGTRPEAIKLFPVIHALRDQSSLRPIVCVTGQHGAMVADILAMAHIQPDYDLAVMAPGQSLDVLLARLVPALGAVMDEVRPNQLVVQGDTLSALAAGLAAHFRGIPIAHVEAGLRSGDLRHPAPEEAIRKMLAAIADVHFAPTAAAAAALAAENIPAERIHITGNSGIDALLAIHAQLAVAPDRAADVNALLRPFADKRVIAVTVHRRENQGDALLAIAAALAQLADRPDLVLVYPLHPNPHIRAAMQDALGDKPNALLAEPFDYPNFVALLDRAALVLTDSGGIQEEAPALGKPVLVLRDTTERPEAVAAGTARLVGTQTAHIVAAVYRLLDDPCLYAHMARAHNPYGDGQAAAHIVKVLAHG